PSRYPPLGAGVDLAQPVARVSGGTGLAARGRTSRPQGVDMLDLLRDLAAHSEWANAVFFHAWAKSPARDHEEMRRRVGHVVGVQEGFLTVLQGGPVAGPPPGPPP